MRGAQRNNKRRKKQPPIKGDKLAWAEGELDRLDPLIEKTYQYLEAELERVTEKEGNGAEAIRILQFLWKRQDRALTLQSEGQASRPASAARSGRPSLTGPLDPADFQT